jgi:glutamine amidotransferase
VSTEVTVVDYGLGNIFSICRAIEAAGAAARVSAAPADVRNAERLFLPGVGAFGVAIAKLRETGLDEATLAFIATGRPFIGVCLGMQLLFDRSEEFGGDNGLGVIPGPVIRIPDRDAAGTRRPVPHIGWTRLVAPQGRDNAWDGALLSGTPPDNEFYFVHSFAGSPADARHRLADFEYGEERFCAAVAHENVTGFQFHPEKSAGAGLDLIKRFVAR